jgi:protein CMS1
MAESDSVKYAKSPKRKWDNESAPEKRSAKHRKSKKPKDIADQDLDTENGINVAVSHMDGRLLADYVAQRTKRFQPELSLVELEDRYIPGIHLISQLSDRSAHMCEEKAILDTTGLTETRTLENLPEFLDSIATDDLSVAPESKGSPHTIVVAAAGLRAAELTR